MSQDQPFIWKTLLGGPIIWVGWSPGDLQGGPDSVCQVDGVSDMTPTCQLCSFEEEGSEMRQQPPPTFLSRRKLSPSSCLGADTSISPHMPLVPFKLLPHCWNSEQVSLSKSLREFLKRNCLGLQQFLPPTQSPLMFAARSYGDFSSWHWNLELSGLVWGWDPLLLRSPSRTFTHHVWMWGQPILCLCPSNSLNGCGFFNPIVVRLPFTSISDTFE